MEDEDDRGGGRRGAVGSVAECAVGADWKGEGFDCVGWFLLKHRSFSFVYISSFQRSDFVDDLPFPSLPFQEPLLNYDGEIPNEVKTLLYVYVMRKRYP